MEKHQRARGIYNIYKPRYRINALSKSKVWPYKNSRLRRFFTIRAKKLVQGSLFRRFILVFNNLKWTLVRRYVRPYRNKQRPGARQSRYKIYFYHKQQFLNFYGKIKENNFRNFFQKYSFKSSTNNHYFYVAIENRLDMIFFRLRLLPTIYSCNQLIHHHGLLVNDKLKTSPNYIVQIADIVSIKQKDIFDVLLHNFISRLKQRKFANFRLKRRVFTALKKKSNVLTKIYKSDYFQHKMKIFRKFFMLNYYMINFYKELCAIIFWILKKTLDQIKFTDKKSDASIILLNFYIDIFKKLNLLKKKFKRFKSILYLKFKRDPFWKKMEKTIQQNTVVKSKKIVNKKITSTNLVVNTSHKYRIAFHKKFKKKWDFFILFCFRKQTITKTNSFKKFFEVASFFSLKKHKKLLRSLNRVWKKYKNKKSKKLGERFFFDGFARSLESRAKSKAKRTDKEFKKEIKAFYQKSMLQIFSAYRVLNFLNLKISLYEVQFYRNLLIFCLSPEQNDISLSKAFSTEDSLLEKNIIKKNQYDVFFFNKLLAHEEFVLLRKYLNKKLKIDEAFALFLHDLSKKSKLIGEKKLRSYFFVVRALKKKRRIMAPRLKKVHWFVPRYLCFDFYTLRCLVIKQISTQDVHLAFKSSLKRLYVFYKSLAF